MARQFISFDWAMKKLLRSKANFGVLAGFLSELLFTDITIVEVLESESNREYGDNKQNRVDIKVRNSKDELILIEIQYSREYDYLLRLLFETSKCVSEHLKKGSAYTGVAKVISVSILYFDFCQGDDYVYHGTTNFIGLHKKTQLQLSEVQKNLFNTDKVSDLFPEHYIINVNKFNDVATDSLDEWIYFLKNEEIEPHFKAKGLIEAKELLDVMRLSEAEKIAYDNYQTWLHRQASLFESNIIVPREEGRREGRKEGREEGKIEEKEASARKMLKKGVSIEDIAEFTGLSPVDIENLQK